MNDVDESDVGVITNSLSGPIEVDENAPIGTTVGLTAHAADADATATIIYSLDDDAGGLFVVDGTTGVVSVAGIIDRETAAIRLGQQVHPGRDVGRRILGRVMHEAVAEDGELHLVDYQGGRRRLRSLRGGHRRDRRAFEPLRRAADGLGHAFSRHHHRRSAGAGDLSLPFDARRSLED